MIGASLWPPSSSDHSPLDYVMRGILENKANETSHPNIGLLKIAIVEEWNKICKEFNLKEYKLFQRHVDTMIEKKRQPY